MQVGTCCIHFYIYRSSNPEVFFKKGVLQIFRQLTGEHPCKSSAWAFLCKYATYLYLFLVKASGELLLFIALNREIIDVEVRCKKVKNCLKYILILLTLFGERSRSGC